MPKFVIESKTIQSGSSGAVDPATSSSSMGVAAELSIDSADMIQLMQATLLQTGMVDSCRALQAESGVALPGLTHSQIGHWVRTGQWGLVLQNLQLLQVASLNSVLLEVHEQVILELALQGHLELAYATLRLVQEDLEKIEMTEGEVKLNKRRDLEQRLAALAAAPKGSDQEKKIRTTWFGKSSQQACRDQIAQKLEATIPVLPSNRLPTLLQQAVQWQSFTGQLPMVREIIEESSTSASGENAPKRKKRRKRFDLVMGEAKSRQSSSSFPDSIGSSTSGQPVIKEDIPRDRWNRIKFGKAATCEACVFLPDGSALVTGSSDGLIELWGSVSHFEEYLPTPYQQKDELLGHDQAVLALAVSNDGTLLASGDSSGLVKVHRIDTGKCLRKIQAYDNIAISCLAWTRDGSKLLTGSQDGTCREWGLIGSKLLKEFRGHTSFVTSCQYVVDFESKSMFVVTSAADGTVRIWDGPSASCMLVLQGSDHLDKNTKSLVKNPEEAASSVVSTAAAVHTVLYLEETRELIMVQRSRAAFRVDWQGRIQQSYRVDHDSQQFVAACLSVDGMWLYVTTQDGSLLVFDIRSGSLETTLRNFAEDSTSKSKGDEASRAVPPEISGLVCHPQKPVLAAFSNDKTQKKGVLTLWR